MTDAAHGAQGPSPDPPAVSIRDLAFTLFMIGLTSYGGPAIVAQIRRVTVMKKGWLTEGEFEESLAFCQTLPGPIAVQTAAHVAWRLRGPLGALVATAAYVLPAFLLMVGLSAAYMHLGQVPSVVAILRGLRAVVVAIVADSILSMAKPALKDGRGVLLGVAAAAALILHTGALLVLLGSALLAIPLLWGTAPPGPLQTQGPAVKTSGTWKGAAAIVLVALIFAGVVVLSGLENPVLPAVAVTMAKVDMLAFGGGYTAVALMHDLVVTANPWLTNQEFLDGLALGQITPGPVILTATFIGYKVAGPAGALTATAAVFLPSWLLLVLLAPQFARIRGLVLVHRMVRGLLAAFVAMLAYVLWQVSLDALTDRRSLFLAVAALVPLRLKVAPLWVVAGGVLLSVLLFR